MTDSECNEFVFLWWDECDNGIFLTQEYFELLSRYHYALTATTWGQFLEILGPFAGFVLEFTQNDDYRPEDEDLLQEIDNGVWVLYDCEFPITQCAEETYRAYSSLFPVQCQTEIYRTEYGEKIGFFRKSAFLEMEMHLAKAGKRVIPVRSAYPQNIYHSPF